MYILFDVMNNILIYRQKIFVKHFRGVVIFDEGASLCSVSVFIILQVVFILLAEFMICLSYANLLAPFITLANILQYCLKYAFMYITVPTE
jgi:hypothetical protein